MQTLSSSIALALALPHEYTYDDNYFYSNDFAQIVNMKFDEMPCWNDAIYALRLVVLMWVSFNCPQNAMSWR